MRRRLSPMCATAVAAVLLTALPVAATADDRKAILESCARDTNLPEKVCECIADRAPSDLDGPAYTFFVAMISGNEAEQARLRATTPPQDLMAAAMFMTNAPAQCAG